MQSQGETEGEPPGSAKAGVRARSQNSARHRVANHLCSREENPEGDGPESDGSSGVGATEVAPAAVAAGRKGAETRTPPAWAVCSVEEGEERG